MKRLDIASYFELGVYREDVIRGKPDPEVFLKAAGLVNVAPPDCAVIEDAERGFTAGKAAGMFVIGRKAGHNKAQDFSKADRIITDMRDILSIIQAL